MKRIYDHTRHNYVHVPNRSKVIDRLGDMRGVHNDKIADAQPSGLYIWFLVLFVGFALLTKTDAVAEQHALSMCLMGVCL